VLKKAEEKKDAAEIAAAQEARKKAETDVQAAEKKIVDAGKIVKEFVESKRPEIKDSLRGLAERALQQALANPNLIDEHAKELAALLEKAPGPRKTALETTRKQLLAFGPAANKEGLALALQPLRPGTAPLSERLTAYEKALLARYNAEVLANLVYPDIVSRVSRSWQVNYVDHRLTATKSWRDVYHYGPKGGLLGWTRYDGEKAARFNPEGLLVLEKDDLGRCLKARTVKYQQTPPERPGPNGNPLKMTLGDEIVSYDYDGPQDEKGRVKSRQPAGAEKE
jgi:hypothetical protein